MKVFFVSTPRAKKKLGDIIEKIFEEIINLGYIHTSSLLREPLSDFNSRMKKGEKEEIAFYKDMVNSIKKADICIFEATVPSAGVGYLINKSLSLSKPTVILFYKETRSYLLPGIEDERLVIFTYDKENYRQVLKKAFREIKNYHDRRFNFFLNPKTLSAIEQRSRQLGMTKSAYVRGLIIDNLRK